MIKIWDLTGPEAASHMPNKPTYALHPSYPIRRVLWRPGYECELAVVSHADFTISSHHVDHHHHHVHPVSPLVSVSISSPGLSSGIQSRVGSSAHLDSVLKGSGSGLRFTPKEQKQQQQQQQQQVAATALELSSSQQPILDAVEIWDVRRSWVPKWSVSGTFVEGGVTGKRSRLCSS
jgi:hypothetical protein